MATRTKFTSPEDEVEQVQNKFGDLIGIYNAALSLSETQKELVLVQSIKSWKELVSRLEDMELSKREMALHKGSTVYGDDNGQPYPKIVFLLTHSYSHLS